MPRSARVQAIDASPGRRCAGSPLSSSRSGSDRPLRRSPLSSPSFLPIALPPARIGRVYRVTGPDGSTKGSPSFGACEPASRNASDAVAFRSTDARLQIRPIASGAEGLDRATGSPELWLRSWLAAAAETVLSRGKSRDRDAFAAHPRRHGRAGCKPRGSLPWRPAGDGTLSDMNLCHGANSCRGGLCHGGPLSRRSDFATPNGATI